MSTDVLTKDTSVTTPPPPGNGQSDPPPPSLLPHHLRALRARGLTDETIRKAGIQSETDHTKIAAALNRKRWPRKCGPAIVIPFRDEDGAVVLQRVWPDHPQKQNGTPAKYLSPTGACLRAYFPPGVRDALAESKPARRETLMTEGEFKALAAMQHGFPAIGLTGVDCWHPKKKSSLLPDLERIDWKNRDVFIVFDSDAAGNPNIKDNESLLAAVLETRGARVRVVRLPAGLNGEKVGLDDFLAAQSDPVGALRKLLDEAEEPEPPDPGELKQPISDMLPEEEARQLLEMTKKDGHPRLRFWRENFYRWTGNRYQELSDAEVRAAVARHLNKSFTGVNRSSIADVVEQLKAQSILPNRMEPPTWLAVPTCGERPPQELLFTKNKTVHLPSVFGGGEFAFAPTPRMFNTSSLAFDFLEANECPKPTRWLQFLAELWPDDAESIETLQTWFGLCIVADTRQHKILMIVGPKRSGKGTIGRVLRGVVGADNVAGPTLSSFSTNFGLWALLHKTLAIISDARLSGRTDAAIVVERLLSISGEDALTVDRKFSPPVCCKLPTRLMLLSNELPRLTDAAGALSSRLILLRLKQSFYGREDTELTDTLMTELPGVLWWAIDGWRTLQERGRLSQPEASKGLIDEFSDLGSPVAAFVRDRCDVGPECDVSRADMYDAYVAWCKTKGRAHIEDEAGFGRNLHAILPDLQSIRPRIGAHRPRLYQGVTLRPEL